VENILIKKKPTFQEFHIIPKEDSLEKSQEKNKEIKSKTKQEILLRDNKFSGQTNDEDAWMTSLNEREILDILKKQGIDIGIDIAASSFYKRKNIITKTQFLKEQYKNN